MSSAAIFCSMILGRSRALKVEALFPIQNSRICVSDEVMVHVRLLVFKRGRYEVSVGRPLPLFLGCHAEHYLAAM
jgi:hypothetical protein